METLEAQAKAEVVQEGPSRAKVRLGQLQDLPPGDTTNLKVVSQTLLVEGGQVTFLFGDVERSTELLARLGDAWSGVLETMRRQVRDCASANAGEVVDMRADECFLAFARPADALQAAIDLRRRLAATPWPEAGAVLLRIGLHTGWPELTSSGYVGIDVHRAARVMAAGNGGQIVTSEAFAAAIEGALPADTRLSHLGAVQLRGFAETENLFLVSTPA